MRFIGLTLHFLPVLAAAHCGKAALGGSAQSFQQLLLQLCGALFADKEGQSWTIDPTIRIPRVTPLSPVCNWPYRLSASAPRQTIAQGRPQARQFKQAQFGDIWLPGLLVKCLASPFPPFVHSLVADRPNLLDHPIN